MPLVKMPNGMKVRFPDMPKEQLAPLVRQTWSGIQEREGGSGKNEVLASPSVSSVSVVSGFPDRSTWALDENGEEIPDISRAVDMVTNMGKNFLPSAGRAVSDFANAVLHPIDTGEAVAKTALGYSQKGWRNLFGGDVGSYEPYADAVNRFYADRYGSLDAAKKTFETDPVGAFSDVMGALSLAGGVARGGAKVASVAGKTGAANALGYSADILRDIAKASDPMRMAAKAVTVPIGKAADVMGFSPEGLYAAALKQSTAAPVKKRDEAVKLGLRERVTPSRGGFYDLDTREKALQGEVGRIIDDKSGVGVTVDPWAVALRSLESLNNYLNAYTNAKGVKKEAWKAIDGFLDSHGERPLSLREAQDIKTKAQMEARKAFGETDITPQQHAAKALAYELRNEIEKAAPEVIPLNRRLSDLHKLDDAVQRAAARTGNWNPWGSAAGSAGLFGALGAGAGSYLGGAPGAAVGGFLGAGLGNVLRRPETMAGAAFTMDAMRNSPKLRALLLDSTPTNMAAYHAGRLSGLLGEFEKERGGKK